MISVPWFMLTISLFTNPLWNSTSTEVKSHVYETLAQEDSCIYVQKLKDATRNEEKRTMNFTVLYRGKSVNIHITESYFNIWDHTYHVHVQKGIIEAKNIKIVDIDKKEDSMNISAKMLFIWKSMEVTYIQMCEILKRTLAGEKRVPFDDITSLVLYEK